MTITQSFTKVVSALKKKHRNKKQLSHLNETLNDFMLGIDTNADAIQNETLQPPTSNLFDNFGRFTVGENSASHDQVIEKNIADRNRKQVDSAVTVVEIECMTRFGQRWITL